MSKNSKIALVTGGSRGLGKNSAIALSKKGIDVIITYNKEKEKADLVVNEIEKNGCKAFALQLDVGNVASHEVFAAKLSDVLKEKWNQEKFDFLINNAGFGIMASFVDTTEEQFDSLMNVHFKGVFFLTQKLTKLIADNGRIINFSTGLARFVGPGFSAYAAMKGAIEILTKYMAKELGDRGIRVNVVAPGVTNTDFHHGGLDNNQVAKDMFGSQTALGRVGEPDDIGGVVASLCTAEMSWVTGERIEASGGMLL